MSSPTTPAGSFSFHTASRIVFGSGAVGAVGAEAAKLGKRVFAVTGGNRERFLPVRHLLSGAGLEVTGYPVSGEPDIGVIEEGVEKARAAKCDVVVGFGGGSPLDSAKAIASMLTNEGELLDYLEVIGRGKKLSKPAAPTICVPTTSGTGSEVTINSVISSKREQVKVSLRSPLMLPHLALVDPELTISLPPDVTANTGMDAITQALEAFTCPKANPFTDALCRDALARAGSLRRAYANGKDVAARADMAMISVIGGIALANAGLGAVHGFGGPIGGMVAVPHGALCAALLPPVMEANVNGLRKKDPDSPYLARYDEAARLMTGKKSAKAEDGVEWVQELCKELNIAPLSMYGMTREHFPEAIRKSAATSSMKVNPCPLSDEDLEAILAKAL